MVMKITECCFFESSYSTFGSYGMLAGKGVKVKHLIDWCFSTHFTHRINWTYAFYRCRKRGQNGCIHPTILLLDKIIPNVKNILCIKIS